MSPRRGGLNGQKRVTVGRHPLIGAEQARQRAALIITRIKAGEEPVPLPLAAKFAGGPTVTDLARRYLEEHVAVRCKPKTARTTRSVVNRHIVPALGRLPLAAVERQHVMELHESLCETPAMANMTVKTLTHMYALARDWGHSPGRQPSVPVHPDEPQAQPGAVPDRHRVHPVGAGAGRGFGQGQPRIDRRGGDDPSAHADGLPQKRNPDPALGACRSRRGRDSSRRREDWRPHGSPVAVGGPRPQGPAAQARQSLGHSGSQTGQAHDRHRRVVGGHPHAGRAPRRAHSRYPDTASPRGRLRSARACRSSAGSSGTARSKPPRAMRTSRATPSRNPPGGSPPASTPTFCRRYNSGYLSHAHACFSGHGGPTRRGPAQSSAIPRFFALSAETGAGARHHAESGRIQTPDHGWLSMASSPDFGAFPATYLSRFQTAEIHDTRSTAQLRFPCAGPRGTLPLIGRLLRHSDMETTARYGTRRLGAQVPEEQSKSKNMV